MATWTILGCASISSEATIQSNRRERGVHIVKETTETETERTKPCPLARPSSTPAWLRRFGRETGQHQTQADFQEPIQVGGGVTTAPFPPEHGRPLEGKPWDVGNKTGGGGPCLGTNKHNAEKIGKKDQETCRAETRAFVGNARLLTVLYTGAGRGGGQV